MANENKKEFFKFIFSDGKTIEFNKYTPKAGQTLYVGQPAKRPGAYTHTVQCFVPDDVKAFDARIRNAWGGAKRTAENIPIMDAVHIGITAETLTIGIPKGAYVPLRWNQYNSRFEIYTETLENDELILEPSIATPETIAKYNKIKEEENANLSTD